MKIILASSSPRRKELLGKMGLDFITCPSDFDEVLDESLSPVKVAEMLALGKARNVAKKFPKDLIIGSDTLVWINNKQLGKPKDTEEAINMLNFLAGKASKVTTSIALINISNNLQLVKTDTTVVHFKPYNAEAVAKYVATGDPFDKAGGYGIQSGAAPLISHIEGNYDTVVGLPTILLADMLREVGIYATPAKLKLPIKQIA